MQQISTVPVSLHRSYRSRTRRRARKYNTEPDFNAGEKQWSGPKTDAGVQSSSEHIFFLRRAFPTIQCGATGSTRSTFATLHPASALP